MEYRPRRLVNVTIERGELPPKAISSMFHDDWPETVDDMVKRLQEVEAYAIEAGYTDVTINIEAAVNYDCPTLDWVLSGSRMETLEEMEVRKKTDIDWRQKEEEKKIADEAAERAMYAKLKKKYSDSPLPRPGKKRA